MTYIVAALYKFIDLPYFQTLRAPLTQEAERLDIRGTLLLACEGINGTISATVDSMRIFLEFLKTQTGILDLEYKESFAEKHPFFRLKIRLKKEIVTLGQPQVNVHKKVGTYVEPSQWNALITDPDVLVIDNRNAYEIEMGTFQGAINPKTQSFRQFPGYIQENLDPTVHKKVALFCTGGIRCEKSSSYMLDSGFETVYHLKGGILKYLEQIPASDSLWQGECFVFDQRVGLQHGLTEGTYAVCFGCRHPLSLAEKQSPYYQEGIHCSRCYDQQTPEKRQRLADRQHQITLAKHRGKAHMGKDTVNQQKK